MITSKTISQGILKAVATLVLVCAALYFIYKIQTVILYITVSLVLCLIANPFTVFLKKRLKFSNLLATITVLFIFVLSLIGFVLLFVPLIISQAQNLSLLDTNMLQNQVSIIEANVENYFNLHQIDVKKIVSNSDFSSKVDFNYFTDFLNSVINTIANFGMGIASVFFITFFFLKDQRFFKEKAKMILPDQNEDKILNSVEKINHLLARYLTGLLIQLLVVFIMYFIVLLIFGNENALIIAFLCALLNVIPYIGPIIATVLAAILTLISNIGAHFSTEMLPTTIYVVIGFLIVQVIDNNVSQPIIFSKSVKSHPLEIFLVTLISGITFGIFGMVVAIPIYTSLKVIAKEFFPDNKIVAVLTENI
ncbi:Predicted PurR-regulated permease PerM [Flavobacterium glycines]|uniref:AI-2E family transporter n=1 Tax=Flavobacterium glycines TaxID=551990 RepID=A0A1B9DJA9_9FLAO|nr:AI-2E family transporter [Flavobacterium glycines]OCB69781.1 AI-2E family transporter [Flavobacterium glycines]GEL12113.1 AI-2E family transporter [Flavobacterium glycines]SDJ88194.1 Predicted PurR-regulated permease PerM [Flavobacterium glycines]